MATRVCFVALEAVVWALGQVSRGHPATAGHGTPDAGEALVVLEGGWAHAGGVQFRLGGAVIKEAAVPALSSLPRLDVAAS